MKRQRNKLIITNKTKWAQIAPFWSIVSYETKQDFYTKVQQYYKVSFWDMTIKQLYKIVNNEFIIPPNDTAFCQIFYFALQEWANDFVKIINTYTMKDGGKNTYIKLSFAESVLIEMQQYFFCRSFTEVENLYISDYVLMRKAKYNNYMQEKAMLNNIKNKQRCQR